MSEVSRSSRHRLDALRLGLSAMLTTGLASIAASAPAQDFSKVEIKTLEVAPGIHMLVGRGGNLAVSSGEDGVVVIDDQFAPLHEKIVAAIGKIGPQPIRFVLNTHWHGDHTGGNELLSGLGAVIVAHDNVRVRMSETQFNAVFDRETPPAAKGALPIVTFGKDVTFHLNGDEIHVVHVPAAHTDGDVLVHFRTADVLHTGDVYFSAGYPFIDLDSGGTVQGLIAALDQALEVAGPGTRIIPGHGPVSDEPGLLAFRKMVIQVRDRVKSAIDSGTSLATLIESNPLEDLEAQWGGGFINGPTLLQTVYESLSES